MENISAIKKQWETFKLENPKVRIRDAARTLGTAEAALVATAVGETAIRLNNQFQELLKDVESLGYVMALTRNDHCVHERKGVYKKLSFKGTMGLAVNPDIDLRLFMGQWTSGFAVNENDKKSLQFFGKDGEAVHKIYLTDTSDENAYDALVAKYTAADQDEALTFVPAEAPLAEKPDSEVAVAAFQQAWLGLEDTHDFYGLLKTYGLSRTQALRLAPEGHAFPLQVEDLKSLLNQVSVEDLEIMVFTSSLGCIQIHTGLAKKILQAGPWFNIMDPEFNMHLREDGIDAVWLVKKPTTDGIVTSIEVFDAAGNIIVQFFGKRKPGIPENQDWSRLANSLLVTS